MSEDTNANTTTTGSGNGGGTTFTQADLDRIVADRIARERKKFADYDDLKAAAAAADKDKSEIQKLTETVSKLSSDLETSKADTVRAEVAAAKGVPKELLVGKTKEELESYADSLLAFRGQQDKGGKGKNDDGAGNGTGDGKNDDGAGDGDGDQTPWGGSTSNDNDKQHLRDGTVPGAGATSTSGEELAKRVWERNHGGI